MSAVFTVHALPSLCGALLGSLRSGLASQHLSAPDSLGFYSIRVFGPWPRPLRQEACPLHKQKDFSPFGSLVSLQNLAKMQRRLGLVR